MPNAILLDTDPGIDDALALLFLHRHPRARLVGITTVFGNAATDVTTRNALYLCERFGIDVPVARGAEGPLQRAPRGPAVEVHGDDGLGNLGLPLHVQRRPETTPAWRFIVDTLHRMPGQVTLLAIGPLTNLALALAHDPSIAGLAREVVVMGGAFGIGGQGGNVSPVAEANIMGDPHAADAVFRAPWPVTIVGLDVTHQVLMGHTQFDHLRLHGGAAGGFIWDCSRHYVGFYGRHLGVDGCYVHDGSAAAYVLAPQLFRQQLGAVRVVDDGIAMGQTIQALRAFPHATAWDGLPAQRVCAGVDADGVLELIRQTLCSG